MATSFKSTMQDYSQLNTVPALSGILFAISAAVQFLGATVSLKIPSYMFNPGHALFVSMGVLILAFASSDTKDWRYYETWEQVTVAVAVVTMVGAEYITTISDFIATNDPVIPIAAFILSLAAWSVLAR